MILVCGFDISLSVMAATAVLLNTTTDEISKPVWECNRWYKETSYIDRIYNAASGDEIIRSLAKKLKFKEFTPQKVVVGVEEPWPFGMVKRAQSGWLKQQAEINGSFLGGLTLFSYDNIFQINQSSWKSTVAKDLNTKVNKQFDKWTVKQWSIDKFKAPDWPDIISSSKGHIPKPETSKAKPIQPDDRYDSTGIMFHTLEIVREGTNR